MTTCILTEALDITEARADTNERALRGVTLIRAGMSRNRRFYGEDVLARAVVVFEGAQAYLNHPASPRLARGIQELSGYYRNVRMEAGALKADRYFTRTAAGNDAWAIAEEIVSGRAPATLAGLSINAVGNGALKQFEDGEAFNVESITAANSVDDVTVPAAGGTYLAAGAESDLGRAFLEALTFEEFTEARADYIARLKKEWQAVRQDEAVKAAKAEADQARRALEEMQAQMERLQSERDTAVTEAETARRERDLERVMASVSLPLEWSSSLREQLATTADTGQWTAIIENEKVKARAAGWRVPVAGAGQQVNAPLPPVAPRKTAVVPMQDIRSPEELMRFLGSR